MKYFEAMQFKRSVESVCLGNLIEFGTIQPKKVIALWNFHTQDGAHNKSTLLKSKNGWDSILNIKMIMQMIIYGGIFLQNLNIFLIPIENK